MATIVTTRQPTLRFLRDRDFESGVRAVICWNGSMDSGDGVPGWTAVVDWDSVVQDGGPFDIFARTDGLLGGGWGTGGWGKGPWGSPQSWFSWRVPFALRDGDYTFGVLLEDRYGNRQAGPGSQVSCRVIATPRAPSDLRITEYDAGTDVLTLAFTASPEFA